MNSALRKYLRLTLIKDVQNFVNVLPDKTEAVVHVPTKQMLEYVLLRIMAFSKLMFRITTGSKRAAVFYLDRIKRGESHWMCLMPYALLSRVWSMSLVLLQHSCNWYNQLFPILDQLEYKGLKFLPENYVLPSNLENWIDMKNLNNVGRFEWSQKFDTNFASLMDEDEDKLSENILKFVDKINDKNTGDLEQETQLLLPKTDPYVNTITKLQNDDQGEAISRDSFKKFMKNLPPVLVNPSVEKVRKEHSIENISDGDSLNEFVCNEETYRNNSDEKSLTSHLSFMQWQALKNILEKLDCALMNKKKLQIKIKKIWKERCLEYIM